MTPTHSPPPSVIFMAILEEDTSPLARRLLWGRMIWEIVRSHSPNKVLWAIPPPVDTAEQLLPWSTTNNYYSLPAPLWLLLKGIDYHISYPVFAYFRLFRFYAQYEAVCV